MHLGVHSSLDPAATKQKFPGSDMTRVFIGGKLSPQNLVTKFRNACSPSWNAGMIPVVSFKPDPASGDSWNVYLDGLGEWLSDQKPAWVVPWHEPENDFPASTFRSIFKRVRDHLAPHKIPVGYAAMAYQWRPSSSSTKVPNDWRVSADFYGCDVYSGESFPLSNSLREHAGFQRWLKTIQAWGAKSYCVLERGAQGDNTVRADMIKRDGEYLGSTSCLAYLYWSDPGTENDTKWVLDAKGELALKKIFSVLSVDQLPEPTLDVRKASHDYVHDALQDVSLTDVQTWLLSKEYSTAPARDMLDYVRQGDWLRNPQ